MIMVLLLPALPYFFKLVPAVIFLPLIGVLVIYYFLSYHLQLVTRYNILISEKTDQAAELEWLVKLRSEELEKTIQALYARSITDPLTGLFPRQHFHEVIDQLIEDKTPFGVLTFDYDKFKYINDTFTTALAMSCLPMSPRTSKTLCPKGPCWRGLAVTNSASFITKPTPKS